MLDLNIIVAADEQNAIGLGGQMPWHLPADLKYFKATTMGCPIIMGRKTYESIGRPLSGRRNIVISRQEGLSIDGCEVFTSLQAAMQVLDGKVFVIGGAQIYQLAWAEAQHLYITRVHTRVPAFDAAIPAVDPALWKLQQVTEYAADEKNAYPLSFEVYERQS